MLIDELQQERAQAASMLEGAQENATIWNQEVTTLQGAVAFLDLRIRQETEKAQAEAEEARVAAEQEAARLAAEQSVGDDLAGNYPPPVIQASENGQADPTLELVP